MSIDPLAVATGEKYISMDGAWIPLEVQGVTSHTALVETSAPDSHPLASVTGLTDALAAKADTSHTHTGFLRVTVSATAPTAPAVGDIWI